MSSFLSRTQMAMVIAIKLNASGGWDGDGMGWRVGLGWTGLAGFEKRTVAVVQSQLKIGATMAGK